MTTTQAHTQAHEDLLAHAVRNQRAHEAATSAADRKSRGQVFTPPEVCRFMAALLAAPGRKYRLLDPGAGAGSLAAAACDRIRRLRSPRQVELHLYETDKTLIPKLRSVIDKCETELKVAGHTLSATVHEEDFLLAHASAVRSLPLFPGPSTAGTFDAVIMNPPYFKVNGDSQYAQLLQDVVHGQPNIYALFMAVAAQLLRPNGDLVAITPRSFCNGLYFRGFRRWFFERMALTRAHLFDSRRDTFREAGILQESVITRFTRLGRLSPTVTLSTSRGRDHLGSPTTLALPTNTVLDDSTGDMVLRLPCTAVDAAVIEAVESWPQRFEDEGLRVSTGPVVSFRARQFLRDAMNGSQTVRLILVGNITPFETLWPKANGKPTAFAANEASKSLLVPTRNYVLLRRFSAKEERRRLTASCLLARDFAAQSLALENHLNYVYHASRELTEAEVLGLAGLLNSHLADRYFRTLSGNTQVNATELRTMPVPPLPTIQQLGKRLQRSTLTPQAVERAVLDVLTIDEGLATELIESAA